MFCLNNYRSYTYVRSEEIRSNREFYTREFSVRIWDFEWQWVRVYYSVIFCFVSFNWIFTHELISIKWLLFLCDICTRTCIQNTYWLLSIKNGKYNSDSSQNEHTLIEWKWWDYQSKNYILFSFSKLWSRGYLTNTILLGSTKWSKPIICASISDVVREVSLD